MTRLRADGIEIWAEDGRLRFRGPPGRLDQPTRDAIAARREAILAALCAASPGGGDTADARGADARAIVAACWRRVLGSTVPDDRPFFEAGGSSRLALRLQAELEAGFSRVVPIAALFEHPTIAAQAAFLDSRHRDQEDVAS
nr:phosphopantetheine-binding protein [Rhodoplanes tepidamans]